MEILPTKMKRPAAGIVVLSSKSIVRSPRSKVTLVPIQTARAVIVRRMAFLLPPSWPLLSDESALIARVTSITASRAITTIAIGARFEAGTHVELNCGRVSATKTMPTMNRANTWNCWILPSTEDIPSFATAHTRNC